MAFIQKKLILTAACLAILGVHQTSAVEFVRLRNDQEVPKVLAESYWESIKKLDDSVYKPDLDKFARQSFLNPSTKKAFQDAGLIDKNGHERPYVRTILDATLSNKSYIWYGGTLAFQNPIKDEDQE